MQTKTPYERERPCLRECQLCMDKSVEHLLVRKLKLQPKDLEDKKLIDFNKKLELESEL